MPGASSRTLLLLIVASACASPTPPPGRSPSATASGSPAALGSAATFTPPPRNRPAGGSAEPSVPGAPGRRPGTSRPLAIDVVYPPAGSRVEARDSTFLYGSVSDGTASLQINGAPVRVEPNGGWLAWVALPGESPAEFTLVARLGQESARLSHRVLLPPRFVPPARGPWIDTLSFAPRGDLWWPRDEVVPMSVHAAEGAVLSLLLPDGGRVPLSPLPTYPAVPAGVRAFDSDSGNLVREARADRYHAGLRATVVGSDPGPMLPGSIRGRGAGPLRVEAVLGRDTVRAVWPVRLALADSIPATVELNDDWLRTGLTDLVTAARARPGASYHWFLPAGTITAATARHDGDLRIRLAPGQDAWVPAADARPLGPGLGLGAATVGSATLRSAARGATLRIPVTRKVPFAVEETDRRLLLRLYHAAGDLDWIRHGSGNQLVEDIQWRQVGANVEVLVELTAPVWGYRTRWDRGDLLLEIRRPPGIHRERPLAGRVIAVDAGHPPGGSTGPTRLTEAEANLAVALRLRHLLIEAGAEVVMTRPDERAVDLWPRVQRADSADAEVLVSIHNNALPDGVNPFPNHGTSVFYYHPRALPLARFIQAELVAATGLRDLGVARGDLALARPPGMPAVLVEGMFLIVPEQEAALRTAEGQDRYARAVFEGLRRFLLWHSTRAQTSIR